MQVYCLAARPVNTSLGISYLSKVDFIKDHLVGVVDAVESRGECHDGYDRQCDLVIPIGAKARAAIGGCQDVEGIILGQR